MDTIIKYLMIIPLICISYIVYKFIKRKTLIPKVQETYIMGKILSDIKSVQKQLYGNSLIIEYLEKISERTKRKLIDIISRNKYVEIDGYSSLGLTIMSPYMSDCDKKDLIKRLKSVGIMSTEKDLEPMVSYYMNLCQIY